jgi:hypothetical protein
LEHAGVRGSHASVAQLSEPSSGREERLLIPEEAVLMHDDAWGEHHSIRIDLFLTEVAGLPHVDSGTAA